MTPKDWEDLALWEAQMHQTEPTDYTAGFRMLEVLALEACFAEEYGEVR